MSAITAKASRKMKKYAVLTREPRCFLGSFDFSWEQRKLGDIASDMVAGGDIDKDLILAEGQYPVIANALTGDGIVGYYDKEYRVNAPAVTVTGRGDVGHAKARLVNFTPVVRLLSVKSEHDVFFLENAINTLKIVIESTGVPQLTVPQLAKYEVAFPRQLDEEEHIGAFFKQLDHLITLHQRKCVFLFSFFQAFISMIFTASTFSWEQRKLGELVDVCSGRDYKHLSEGTIPVYGTGGYMLSVNDALSYDRDAIGIGRKGTIDRPYILKAPFWTVDTLFYAIPREKVDLNYAFDIFQNIDWKKKDESTGVPSLSKTAINDIDVLAPKHDEQQIIGQFFAAIDNLITLHQRQHFLHSTPDISLSVRLIHPFYTSSWEQRKLGDVVKEITRNDPESEAPIMMITANNGFIEQSERYAFNNAGESLKKYILLKKGELAYNHGASKLRPYGSCFALTTAENARIPFVYHCFSAENQNAEFMSIELNGAEIENQLRKIVSSGARMDGLLNISFDEYTSVSVILPGTEEQDRIADFFRHLDNLITLHQRKPFLMKWRTSDANRNQTNRLVL